MTVAQRPWRPTFPNHGLRTLYLLRQGDTDMDDNLNHCNTDRLAVNVVSGRISDANRNLPGPMRPCQTNRIVAGAAPATGHWQRGQLVWNRNAEGRWTPRGFVKTDLPGDRPPLGWYRIQSGNPGAWRRKIGTGAFFAIGGWTIEEAEHGSWPKR